MVRIKLINIVKQKIRKIKKKIDLFKSLKVGDVVWAEMPLKSKDLKAIEESHRVRPYLIVYKDFFNIYAYPGSSKKSKLLNNYETYGISKLRYKKTKDTWFELDNVQQIFIKKIQTKFATLNVLDLRAIEKRLQIQKNRRKEIKYSLSQEIFITEGDVIWKSGEMYYIYASDSLNLYGLRIFKKHKTHREVKINRKKYRIDFNNKLVIKRNSPMKILDIASIEEIKNINYIKQSLKGKKEEKLEDKTMTKYEIGTVFQAGNSKIVFLYKNDSNYYGIDLLMYKVFPRILEIKNIEEKQIVEILKGEEYVKILEFLLLEKINPHNKIKSLYEINKEIK